MDRDRGRPGDRRRRRRCLRRQLGQDRGHEDRRTVSLPGQMAALARRDDRGALSLTYVVILPVVFLFLASVIQASLWFLAGDAALAAARQGAAVARAAGSSMTAGHAAAMSFARQAGDGFL